MAPISNQPIFVDTSGWCGPVLRSTPEHGDVDAFAQVLLRSSRPMVTTNYVLSEVIPLLTVRAKYMARAQIMQLAKQIRQTTTLQIIHIDKATDDEAWDMLDRLLDKEWSLVDATSFITMRRMGITEVFTTDHHFSQAGFLRVP